MRNKNFPISIIAMTAAFTVVSCAPRPLYRAPIPSAQTPRRPAAPAPVQESSKPLLPSDSVIREQDIHAKKPPVPPVKKTNETTHQASVGELRTDMESPPPLPPPLADDSSLLAKITPATPPQRAASLRLTEEGRNILDGGDPGKALTRLEKTIVIDSTNPYAYFYLAKAQYRLARYRESLNFLDIAESRLGNEPFWLAEIHALRGDNYQAQGQMQRAESNYNQALRLNSGNRTAVEGLARFHNDAAPAASESR